MIDIEQLTKDVKFYMRISLVFFMFFIGVYLGKMGVTNINIVCVFIAFIMGCLISFGFILSKLEIEE